jgi:hypothetical protein
VITGPARKAAMALNSFTIPRFTAERSIYRPVTLEMMAHEESCKAILNRRTR